MRTKWSVSGSKISYNPDNRHLRAWELRDYDGYLIDTAKTPAEIRRARRRWFLYLTLKDAERAWGILEGNIAVK